MALRLLSVAKEDKQVVEAVNRKKSQRIKIKIACGLGLFRTGSGYAAFLDHFNYKTP